MTAQVPEIDAVTFDFYGTLVRHGEGRGRGAALMEYLQAQGLHTDPWEHQVLYDVFEPHEREYDPHAPEEERQRYRERLTDRLFQRLNVRAPNGAAIEHAAHIWKLIGPASLALYPDVPGVLTTLRDAGFRLAVVSNWQCGLRHFCTELGIGDAFEHVLASAEVGHAKPEPIIFGEACRRLGAPAQRVLHVGDTIVDDVEGARGAGMQVVLLRRDGDPPAGVPAIAGLDQLPARLGVGAKLKGQAGGT